MFAIQSLAEHIHRSSAIFSRRARRASRSAESLARFAHGSVAATSYGRAPCASRRTDDAPSVRECTGVIRLRFGAVMSRLFPLSCAAGNHQAAVIFQIAEARRADVSLFGSIASSGFLFPRPGIGDPGVRAPGLAYPPERPRMRPKEAAEAHGQRRRRSLRDAPSGPKALGEFNRKTDRKPGSPLGNDEQPGPVDSRRVVEDVVEELGRFAAKAVGP